MAAIEELPREPTVPPRSGFVGTFLLAGCLIEKHNLHKGSHYFCLFVVFGGIQLLELKTTWQGDNNMWRLGMNVTYYSKTNPS